MDEKNSQLKNVPKRLSPWRLIGTLLGIALTIYLLFSYGVDEFFRTLKSVPLSVFLLALVFTFLSRFMVTLRWLALLRGAGVQMTLQRALRLVFMGLFASNFLPTTVGGDAVRLIGVLQHEMKASTGVASLLMDRVVGSIGMATLLPWGIPMIWPMVERFFVAWWALPVTVRSFSGIVDRGHRFVKGIVDTIGIWLKRPYGIVLALLATYGHMAFTFLAAWVLLGSMQQPISFFRVGILWSLAYFVTLIPISINGLGIQEFSLTYLFTHLGGVEPQAALVLATLMRLLYMLASLPGALFLSEITANLGMRPRG